MTSKTHEQTCTDWQEAAHQDANARDVVDALHDAELMMRALDDPEMRAQLKVDFAVSFWMQRYLPLAVEAGEAGRAVIFSIAQVQRERFQAILNQFYYESNWRVWRQTAVRFVEKHKDELEEPLDKKRQDGLAVQLGFQLLHDQGLFTLSYGGVLGLVALIGGLFMVDNLTVLSQFMTLIAVLYLPVLWLNLASARQTAPMMLKVFRRRYLLQLKKQH